ncbi:hypothetical protein BH23THE1_BH23THE1_20530 [soil metagenome]
MKVEFRVICTKCGKIGFPTLRWVRSYYYPRSRDLLYGYTGDRVDASDRIEVGIPKRKKFDSLYVCHYSKEKYNEQMKEYHNHTRKSRPNGRICHYIPKNPNIWIEPLPETGEKRFLTSYSSLKRLMKKNQKDKSKSKG